jgi:hypothetical protein
MSGCSSLLSTSDFNTVGLHLLWSMGANAEKRASARFRGLLQLSKSGHLVVTVPAAVVRGLYDSLDSPGLSLPKNADGSVRSNIVVMTPEEVKLIGGPDKITERGSSFSYAFGDFFISPAKNWLGVSKCWLWHVKSPDLSQVRRTYGLPAKIDGVSDFSLMIAYQKSGVTQSNGVSKAAQYLSIGDDATYTWSQFRQLTKRSTELMSRWYLGTSEIEGTGIFATDDLSKGDSLGLAVLEQEQDEHGLKFRNLTTLARYCNHSPGDEANVELAPHGDKFELVAKRDIAADEELVADYVDVSNKVGIASDFVYNGELMPRRDSAKLTGRVSKAKP